MTSDLVYLREGAGKRSAPLRHMARRTGYRMPSFRDELFFGLWGAAYRGKTLQTLRIESPRFHRATHGAARLVHVFAIAEFTLRRNLRNFAERLSESLARIPQLQLAHSRRVDQDSAAGRNNQMPRG